ncbi:MAG TPA: hypothetical protein VIL28_17120 [Steroidobacteraceae bacterium]
MKTRHALALWLGGIVTMFAAGAMAMNVVDLSYDASTDELVVKIAYRGTHANHAFTVRWEQCRTRGDGTQEVFGLLLDSEPNDPARMDYQKTLKIGMSQLPCRATHVTIGAANPQFRKTISVPPPKSK